MVKIFSKLPRTFWIANTIELIERWAWYGFFFLFANYLTGSSDMGGLEFSQAQKGTLMGVGTAILYFLPVLTGAIADRYGYKRVLTLAFVIYTTAFLLLPQFHTFGGVFAMYIYLAVGAALFKPVVSATISKTVTNDTASIGFGIFYMMVNIGAFFGPMVTLLFNKGGNSQSIFYISAGMIALNFILLLFYKEPDRNRVQKESLGKTLKDVFGNMAGILKDGKFMLFLLIVAGFWGMYNQLFFTLPVFITQWVDTSAVYNFCARYMPFFSNNYSTAPGVMDAEFIANFDALYIILFQIGISSLVMRLKPLHAMMSGFLVCSLGMALTLVFRDVMYTWVAILIFSIGEMAASPKITEYIGSIAPPDKKALYMGYSFIPVFIGNLLAGVISGSVYQNLSDKVTLVQRFAESRGFSIPQGLSNNDYFSEVARQAGLSGNQLTATLWDTYNPSKIWMIVFGIGLLATIALFLYNKFLISKKR